MDDAPEAYVEPPESELMVDQALLDRWNALPPNTELPVAMNKEDADAIFNAVLGSMRMAAASARAHKLALAGNLPAANAAWEDYVKEYFEGHRAYATMLKTIIGRQMAGMP